MTHILNHIKLAEKAIGMNELNQQKLINASNDAQTVVNLKNKIILDPNKDPDPYGYHGIPLSTRLLEMGWPQ